MQSGYTDEESTLMLIALMKAHGVRKVIASPGMRNMCLVASLQRDPDFTVYSSVDERSAAYMACGMAAQTGEPVALSCTGATASRNYMPGLTEAYHRKLPVLAITSTRHIGEIGQLIPQTVDRRVQPNDVFRYCAQIPMVRCKKDRKSNNLLINAALLELKRDGGGPVHINLETTTSQNFAISKLPHQRVIKRHHIGKNLPDLASGKVAIFVGSHLRWSESLLEAVGRFCEAYDAVVFGDLACNYQGRYKINAALVGAQKQYKSSLQKVTTLIHIGEVCGMPFNALQPKRVWRVSPDGELRDTFGALSDVFEMEELDFFEQYVLRAHGKKGKMKYHASWVEECARVRSKLPSLPFSNGWMASELLEKLPAGSVLHLGIYNSLRMWSLFDAPEGVTCFSNTGGFGIDGAVSTVMGAALSDPERLFFLVVGDLAMFYDLNALGNRHMPANVRILVVNNGMGIEFRNYGHPAAELGDEANPYIAAAGHYGNKSRELLKHYAQDLGFEYCAVESKEAFESVAQKFVSRDIGEKPLLVEAFTSHVDESAALELLRNIESSKSGAAKHAIKEVLGPDRIRVVKRLAGK